MSDTGIDLVVDHPCEVKRVLGEGDVVRGTEVLAEANVARAHAERIRALAREGNTSPESVELTVRRLDGHRRVRFRDVHVEQARLDPLRKHCEGCPAGAGADAFGCHFLLACPMLGATEVWLMEQLQRGDQPGGALLAGDVDALGLTGEPVAALRPPRGKHLQSDLAVPRPVTTRDGETRIVTSDHLLHAVVGLGPRLEPEHCLRVLLWLGAVAIDGAIPETERDEARVAELLSGAAEPSAWRDRVQLVLDQQPSKPAARGGVMLIALFVGWSSGAGVRVAL